MRIKHRGCPPQSAPNPLCKKEKEKNKKEAKKERQEVKKKNDVVITIPSFALDEKERKKLNIEMHSPRLLLAVAALCFASGVAAKPNVRN